MLLLLHILLFTIQSCIGIVFIHYVWRRRFCFKLLNSPRVSMRLTRERRYKRRGGIYIMVYYIWLIMLILRNMIVLADHADFTQYDRSQLADHPDFTQYDRTS